MAEASIFVQPSLEEALGLALQEAIYHGCPAIGTRVGGIPEVIDDGVTGLLVPPGCVASLSQALDRMMSDPHLQQSLGSEGRHSIVAKGMLHETMLLRHRVLYSEVLVQNQLVPRRV